MALIRRIPLEPKINFIGNRTIFVAFSAAMVLASIGLFLVNGLNFGIDFKGGIVLEVRTEEPADLGALRSKLNQLEIGDITLQSFGDEYEVLVTAQAPEGDDAAQAEVKRLIRETLADEVAEFRREEFVGPKVGDELREAGILATVLSMLAISLYIWFRFEWQFAVAALLALLHDVIGTIGFFALTQIEFNLATLAAVLTVAGYSINDTVVVFDRLREEMRRYKRMSLFDVMNMSVNRTLSRTILTSVTTLLALTALAFFGGEVIRGFSTSLIWGILIGTYSSFGLAVPILIYLGLKRGHVGEKPGKEEAEAEASS